MKKKLSLIITGILVAMLLVPTSVFAEETEGTVVDDGNNTVSLHNTTVFNLKIDSSEFKIGSVKQNIQNVINWFKGEEPELKHGSIALNFGSETKNYATIGGSKKGNGFIFSDSSTLGSTLSQTLTDIKGLFPSISIGKITGYFDNNIDLDLASVDEVKRSSVIVKKICANSDNNGYIEINLGDIDFDVNDGITGITVDGDNSYDYDEESETIRIKKGQKTVTVETGNNKIILAIQ